MSPVHDYIIANQGGSSFRSDLNEALAAIVSQNSSATEPPVTYAYQYWIDTGATPELIKQRNSLNDDWIVLGEVDGQTLANDGTETKPSISFASDINTGIYRPAADQVAIAVGGAEKVRINSTGLGVGADPTKDLQISSTSPELLVEATAASTSGQIDFVGQDASGNAFSTARIISTFEGAIELHGDPDDSSFAAVSSIRFFSNGVERGRFNGSQFVVGTTAQDPGNGNVDVGSYLGTNRVGASRNGGVCGHFNRNNSNGNTVNFRKDGNSVGTISVTGSSTSYNTSSDYRLKENVVPLTGSIDRVKALKPSRFNFIAEPDVTVDGFLAHEAQSIVPECVEGEKDAIDEDGNPEYQGIDQSKLVPLLTGALQEALAKIEALEARLDAAGL